MIVSVYCVRVYVWPLCKTCVLSVSLTCSYACVNVSVGTSVEVRNMKFLGNRFRSGWQAEDEGLLREGGEHVGWKVDMYRVSMQEGCMAGDRS